MKKRGQLIPHLMTSAHEKCLAKSLDSKKKYIYVGKYVEGRCAQGRGSPCVRASVVWLCAEVHACHKIPFIMLAINFYSLDATVGIQWTVVVGLGFSVGLGGLHWPLEMGYEGSHDPEIEVYSSRILRFYWGVNCGRFLI